ncbi:MAG: flavodoxin family protein [Campylobacter sp.]
MAKSNKDNNELSFKLNEKCDNACVKKDTLIIYSSLSGNTAKIALVAAKTLGAHCYEIGEFCDKFKINLDENLESIAPNLEQNSAQNLADTNAKQSQENQAQNPAQENQNQASETSKNSPQNIASNLADKNINQTQNLADAKRAQNNAFKISSYENLTQKSDTHANFSRENSAHQQFANKNATQNLFDINSTNQICKNGAHENNLQNLAQNTQILDQSARDFALNSGENLALNIANTAHKNFLQEKLMQENSSQDSKSHNLANKNLTDENHTPNLEQNSKQNPAQNQANENEISKNKAQNLANISQAQNTQICSCKQKNLNSQIGKILNQYENLAIGFWLDRGGATPKFAKFLREICGKKIALFMSCGADPQSEHSQKIIDKVASNLIAQGNEIAGKFVCQGKISDEIIAQIRAIYAQKNIEIPASRIENWEKSRPHPDENDLKNAREFFAKVFC